jgi:hypothetical protein
MARYIFDPIRSLTGCSVLIAGIIRTTAVQNSLERQADITYNFIPRGCWTLVEANLGIICANLPILKKPFNWIFSRAFGTTRTSVGPYTMDRTPHHTVSRSKTNRLQSKDSDIDLLDGMTSHAQIRVDSKG